MPADFRELGPSYRAANPAGVKIWLELEHKAVTSNPFRQNAANRNYRSDTQPLTAADAADHRRGRPLLAAGTIRMVAAQIPNSEVVIMREAGHSSYWEQPEAFNRTVLDFLARHSK